MRSNILIVGSGAREHAIARALARSTTPHQLFCYGPNLNPGIVSITGGYQMGSLTETKAIAAYAASQAIDFAIIGPEVALSAGVVDALRETGIAAIGPSKKLAQIESSKGFARDLLAPHYPHALPRYRRYHKVDDSLGLFLQELNEAYVIKTDGLAAGKGVLLSGEHLFSIEETLAYCESLGAPFVVEEKLVGVEFSLISCSDGKDLIHFPPVQDHKRAFCGDSGPNTGGMGSYTMADHSLPFLSFEDIRTAEMLNAATVDLLRHHFYEPYQGFIYGGFMKTADGIKLIEYNARLGDPEAINLLSILNSNFIDICQGMIQGNLSSIEPYFAPMATVCKYLVPNGYPNKSLHGELSIDEVTHHERLYFGSVEEGQNGMSMLGSRAIAVLGMAESIELAEAQAELTLNQVRGPGFHRSDIGSKALINERIKLTNTICKSHFALL